MNATNIEVVGTKDATSTSARKQFDIIDGPSRGMLFDACAYAYDKNVHVGVKFDVAVGHTETDIWLMKVKDFRITSIGHEDGSGVSLLVEGFCRASLDTYIGQESKACKFVAYYHTDKRKGWISFTEI